MICCAARRSGATLRAAKAASNWFLLRIPLLHHGEGDDPGGSRSFFRRVPFPSGLSGGRHAVARYSARLGVATGDDGDESA